MRMFLAFLAALTMAGASRISTAQLQNETFGTLAFGEACDCYDKSGDQWKENKCCGDGLICSPSTKTCKVAIGTPCNRTMGRSVCAGMGTYGRDTHCSSKQRDKNKLSKAVDHMLFGPDTDEGYLDGQTFCCIKARSIFQSQKYSEDRAPLYHGDRACGGQGECCGGHAIVDGDNTHGGSWCRCD
mmetsp:Transcript_44684/g.73453  ORF Transcript_44684/g.73453 Transcript_44684/m.73453 type:complete len:185 (+) Transcript_44684:102-656(+)